MPGYLPQAILLCLIFYSLVVDFLKWGSMRQVSWPATAIGWFVIIALLILGGFFG